MLFWFFMLLTALLIPGIMVAVGRIFMKKAPEKINSVYGYRTAMSMKNKDTWEFAHKMLGLVWYSLGKPTFVISLLAMLLVVRQTEEVAGIVAVSLAILQLIPLFASIFVVEKALKATFDQKGNRK